MGNTGKFFRTHPVVSVAGILGVICVSIATIPFLITTETEKIVRLVDTVRDGMEDGDASKAVSPLSYNFSQNGIDRNVLEGYLESIFQKHGLPDISLIKWEKVDLSETRAECELYVICKPKTPSSSQKSHYMITSRWKLEFRKGDRNWYIFRVIPKKISGQKINNLKEVLDTVDQSAKLYF